MPSGDRTGPAGMGPMTGRGAGFCTGNPVPGYLNHAGGRGFGGGGWGRRNRYYATGVPGWARGGFPVVIPGVATYNSTFSSSQELDNLKGQAEYFQNALEGIKRRIEELESQNK